MKDEGDRETRLDILAVTSDIYMSRSNREGSWISCTSTVDIRSCFFDHGARVQVINLNGGDSAGTNI